MKSRTSFFNVTVFKKNLTRFAPAWGLYTVCAVMGLLLISDSGTPWFATNLVETVQILSIVTPIYALLCAQLLFGDLYNTRMCNALHALPLRRETWFCTNVISGFVFHLIPTVVMAVLALLLLALSGVERAFLAAPWWLLGVNLQFLCFFGIAVFSAFCVGSRFAQALVFGILNFASALAGWLMDTLYVSQLYGVISDLEPCMYFSPVSQMIAEPFLFCNRIYDESDPVMRTVRAVEYQLGDCFGYYFLAAAVGIGLIFLALQLYRRRKLECAGDFMAIKGLEPVFLVVYSLIVGAVFYFTTEDIIGMDTGFFLFAGLAVGWFTGKMLLERSPRVFRLRNFLSCGVLMAVSGLVLAVAAMDPFGVVSWVPRAADVESVSVTYGWHNYGDSRRDVSLTNPADIQAVIDIHQETVDFHKEYGSAQFRIETVEIVTTQQAMDKEAQEAAKMNFSLPLTFTYRLNNGREVSRYYHIWMGDDTGECIRAIFSSPEAIFGPGVTEEAFLEANKQVVLLDHRDGAEYKLISREDIRGLYRAILADCKAGTMAQQWDFHHSDEYAFWLYGSSMDELTIFSSAENTLKWLRDYGIDVDALVDPYTK